MSKFVVKKETISEVTIPGGSIHGTGAASLVGSILTALTGTLAHIIIGCMVSNIHTATVTVDVFMLDSAEGKKYIVKGVSIPVGGSVELLQGKVVIDDNSEIHAICSVTNKADIFVSVLESS